MEKLLPDQHQAPISRLQPRLEGGVQATLTKLESLGDEFFWGELGKAESCFAKVPGVARFSS
jgi:hypothetical protein